MRSDSVIALQGKGRFGSEIATSPGRNPDSGRSRGWSFSRKVHGQQIGETEREQRKFDANFVTAAKRGNKSFIMKGRGSSVVEQPIRNRQVASSTLALGSNVFRDLRI